MERQPLQLIESDLGSTRRDMLMRGDNPLIRARAAAQFARTGEAGREELRDIVNRLLKSATVDLRAVLDQMSGYMRSRKIRNRPFKNQISYIRTDIEMNWNQLQGMYFHKATKGNRVKGNVKRRLQLLRKAMDGFRKSMADGSQYFSAKEKLPEARRIGTELLDKLEGVAALLEQIIGVITIR